MMAKSRLKLLAILTFILCAITAFTSVCGIVFEKELYSANTPAYIVSSVGTDWGNLLVIIPILLICSTLMLRGSSRAFLIWSGAMMYALYLFLYNNFTLHFNHLFLAYCAEFGIVFYSLFIAVSSIRPEKIKSSFSEVTRTKGTIIYLTVMGAAFIALWLSDILPASISGVVPKSEAILGFQNAPFHVLDLAIFFPGFLIAAYLLLKKNPYGYWMAASLMVYAVIMTLCLVFLTVITAVKGIGFSLSDILLFGSATLLSAIFLVRFMSFCRFQNQNETIETK